MVCIRWPITPNRKSDHQECGPRANGRCISIARKQSRMRSSTWKRIRERKENREEYGEEETRSRIRTEEGRACRVNQAHSTLGKTSRRKSCRTSCRMSHRGRCCIRAIRRLIRNSSGRARTSRTESRWKCRSCRFTSRRRFTRRRSLRTCEAAGDSGREVEGNATRSVRRLQQDRVTEHEAIARRK